MLTYVVAENCTGQIICEADTLDEIKMFFKAYKKVENGYEIKNLTIYKVEKAEFEG